MSHSQFVNCVKGIVLTGSGGSNGTATPLTVNNSLMANVQYPLTANVIAFGNILHQCTIDGFLPAGGTARLVTATASSSWYFTNSIIANVPTLSSGSPSLYGGYNGFYPNNISVQPQFGNTKFASASNPFQTGDYGNYYLNDGSGFGGKGYTSIPSSLLTALKTKTTHPPISFPALMEVTGELTLFPQVPRYVSGAPDLGYYYDALDYTVAEMTLYDGGTITVQPGTAIGLRTDYDLDLQWRTLSGFNTFEGATIVSRGTPNAPITYVANALVQEAWSFVQGVQSFTPSYYPNGHGFLPARLDFRFSNFYLTPESFHFAAGFTEETFGVFSNQGVMDLSLRDCNLRGGQINIGKAGRDPGWAASGTVNWFNNLFDRVNINLDPDWFDDDPPDTTLYNDLGLQAYNNLFRGSRLRLKPIPATAGSWTFRDNLFDKEEFLQDTSQPLDHDYNGYWPLSTTPINEFRWGGTATLTASSNDKTLTSAPAYQNSTFGSYYLPASGLLYNGGSRTPADAGLYHYTTRTDQTKEGAEGGNVNIGLHYVSAASGLPKDTDGDGIPDYAENWHGDGAYSSHTETETDWQNSTTATDPTTGLPIPDASNTIYDDIDLDGDGLTGRAERLLGRSPAVTDNPLNLTPVITGDEPYVLTYSIPLNVDVTTIRSVLTLADNGAPVMGYEFTRQPDNTYRLRWNTTFSDYGAHLLQVRFCLSGASVPLNDGPSSVNVVYGPVRYENIRNIIQFDPDNTSFGSQAWIFGTLGVLEANYQIDIRDTANNLVTTITGYTGNGTIDRIWDLTPGPNQPPRGDQEFKLNVFVTPLNSDVNNWNNVSFPYPLHLFRTFDWGNSDVFTMAFGWDNQSLLNKRTQMIQENVVDVVFDPSWSHEYPNTVLNSFNGTTFFMWATSQKQILLDDLANPGVRNFFWSGHGSDIWFGSARTDADVNLAVIGTGDVGAALNNRKNENGWRVRDHPYRLVIIDSCESAVGPEWANAFGIVGTTHNTEWFQRKGERPQAFVGWFTQFDYPNAQWWQNISPGAGFDQYGASLDVLFYLWMEEISLADCLDAASDRSLSWPLSENYNIFGDPFLSRTEAP